MQGQSQANGRLNGRPGMVEQEGTITNIM